jgi:hypothetical protein
LKILAVPEHNPRMKKQPKIQRIDGPLPSPSSPSGPNWADALDGEPTEKKKRSMSLALSQDDHVTSTSWPDAKCHHTYDVVNSEFTLSASNVSGDGYFTVRLKTNPVYSRIGIQRVINDTKATIKSVRLLQSVDLSHSHTQSDPCDYDGENPESSEAKDGPVSVALKTFVISEIKNTIRYGGNRLVTVKHPQNKEKTDYGVSTTTRGAMLYFTFKSIESEETTGTRSISYEDVSSLASTLLGVGTDDTNFADAFQTVGDKKTTRNEFMVRADMESKRIELLAILPHDSFTGDSDIYCEVASLFVNTTGP